MCLGEVVQHMYRRGGKAIFAPGDLNLLKYVNKITFFKYKNYFNIAHNLYNV